ncbi:hypothetical protein COLO4_05963 [Corchorus olitorius]|uniref:Uncharacterized protein n=1 Tax=Corchorus olitorius TaxID=93759 RepID=A0A1R3KPB1_9ROSI|nr:hypothetical protein COLO4_05963 [Corchorus olitorius]
MDAFGSPLLVWRFKSFKLIPLLDVLRSLEFEASLELVPTT